MILQFKRNRVLTLSVVVSGARAHEVDVTAKRSAWGGGGGTIQGLKTDAPVTSVRAAGEITPPPSKCSETYRNWLYLFDK